MPSTKLLKERIESIQDTMKITNAMYLISSSKLRKARKNYQAVSPYFERMQMTMTRVLPHLPEEPVHPFFHTRNPESPRRAYLVLTADKGMAGAYNQNLLKFLKSHCGDDPKARFYVVGQTGYRALLHKDPRLVEDFLYSGQAPTLQRARDITADMIDTNRSCCSCCRWNAPTLRRCRPHWAIPMARLSCSPMRGRCSSRWPPSTCTA